VVGLGVVAEPPDGVVLAGRSHCGCKGNVSCSNMQRIRLHRFRLTDARWGLCVYGNKCYHNIRVYVIFAWFLNLRSNKVSVKEMYMRNTAKDGVRDGAVHWGTALQDETLLFWFPLWSLISFIELILAIVLWPWGRLSL
jgi:hypothetical protein